MPSDEVFEVDTPEQLLLEYPLAGIGSRFLALLLDTLVQLICVVVGFSLVAILAGLAGALDNAFSNASAPWILGLLILFGFLIQFAYFAGFEAAWNGQTPGKRRFGLRVIKATGRPIDPADAVARNFLRIVDGLPGFYGVAILSAMISPRRQRLGDLVAGTVVVHEQPLTLAPYALSAVAAGAADRRARLTLEELVIVEAFLQRRDTHELSRAVRARLAAELAERIAARTLTPAEQRADPERWLEALVHEAREAAGHPAAPA